MHRNNKHTGVCLSVSVGFDSFFIFSFFCSFSDDRIDIVVVVAVATLAAVFIVSFFPFRYSAVTAIAFERAIIDNK